MRINIILQWIPVNSGITGNEEAGQILKSTSPLQYGQRKLHGQQPVP